MPFPILFPFGIRSLFSCFRSFFWTQPSSFSSTSHPLVTWIIVRLLSDFFEGDFLVFWRCYGFWNCWCRCCGERSYFALRTGMLMLLLLNWFWIFVYYIYVNVNVNVLFMIDWLISVCLQYDEKLGKGAFKTVYDFLFINFGYY